MPAYHVIRPLKLVLVADVTADVANLQPGYATVLYAAFEGVVIAAFGMREDVVNVFAPQPLHAFFTDGTLELVGDQNTR